MFAQLCGIGVDVSELDEQAQHLERALVRHLERAEGSARPAAAGGEGDSRRRAALLQRIEALFEVAGRDRAKALELKALLDEHDLFGDYEDRFLDLFRHGS